MGQPPGLPSVGWHWDKGPLQGPKGGTQAVNLLSGTWIGVGPTRALAEALPGHWMGPKLGGTAPGGG